MTNYYHTRKGHLRDGSGMGMTKIGKDHRMTIKLNMNQTARKGKHPIRHRY